jgi:hypothetical protein
MRVMELLAEVIMDSNKQLKDPIRRMETPWLVVFFYSLIVIIDWIYAYFIEFQPEIPNNSLTMLFPFFSFFYWEFCLIAIIGLYLRKKWGFIFGFIMIISGTSFCAISYLLAFKVYPITYPLFILILVFNLIIILYMIIYCLRHKMNPDPINHSTNKPRKC